MEKKMTEQTAIDINNLRFYARMAEHYKWQTDVIDSSVVVQTLNEIAERLGAAVPAPLQPLPSVEELARRAWEKRQPMFKSYDSWEEVGSADKQVYLEAAGRYREVFQEFFAPAPAQEPRCEYIFRDIGTGLQCDKKRGHDGDHHATMGSIKEGIHVDDPEDSAAQPVENSSRCAKCGEVEDHMNHYADYTLDGSAYHMKDHTFEPISGGASTGEQQMKNTPSDCIVAAYNHEPIRVAEAARPSEPSAPKVEPPKYWQCPNNESHYLKFGEKIYGTSVYRQYCIHCPDTEAVFRSRPTPATETASAPQDENALSRITFAAQALLDIGKRDMSNPKYDGFFEELAISVKESNAVIHNFAAAPSVAGTQPTARCPKCGEEMQGGFFRVSVNSTSAIKWRCKGNDESFHEFIINCEAQLRPFFSGAAQGTPQVEAALKEIIEVCNYWHHDNLRRNEQISAILAKHLPGAPAQPGPEEKK